MKNPEENLDTKLAAWQLEPEFCRDFNREVWRRIAASHAAREDGFWQKLISFLFIAPRYSTASGFAIAMLTLSLGTASLAARSANSRHWSMLENRYVQSIDPLTHSSMKE